MPDTPKPQKAPPPPKTGMDAAEIADVDAVTAAEDDVVAKASGLDKLRIAHLPPTFSPVLLAFRQGTKGWQNGALPLPPVTSPLNKTAKVPLNVPAKTPASHFHGSCPRTVQTNKQSSMIPSRT